MVVKSSLMHALLISLTLFMAREALAQEPSPAQSMGDFCQSLPRAEYADLKRIHNDNPWFELYQVADGVTAIYEPHQWQEVISYLIEGEQQALLFDTGNGIADIAAVVAQLTNKPVSVLNSHSHYDHVGGNYAFSQVYGMDTAFTKVRQHGHSNQSIAIEVSPKALCKQPPDNVNEGNHVGRPYKVTDIIVDGSIIDLGNRPLTVMHVPGHTPDAIVLIDKQHKLMFTGDSFYRGPIWLYAPETNLQQYAESLDKMVSQLPFVHTLLPAHNTPIVDAKVLPDVVRGFQLMLNGKAKKTPQGEGMAEYNIPGVVGFSFLMRDEPLPYK